METTRRHRRPATRWAICLLAGLSVVAATLPATTRTSAAAPGPAATTQAAQQRPNIVLITTDDQAASDLRVMRHVRSRMARRGVNFTNSIAPAPLCCPARASMLTGQYAHNHRVLGNALPWGGFAKFDDSSTVATWLQDSGYATGFIGKYLNKYGKANSRYIPPGWTEWTAALSVVYHYVDYRLNVGGAVQHYRKGYKTYRLNRLAVNFVHRRAPRERPFFLWLSHIAPHGGAPVERDDPAALGLARRNRTPAVPARYTDRFDDKRLPRPPGFNEANVRDKPSFIRDQRRLRPKAIAAIKEGLQQRREALLAVDDGVDALLNALRRHGELDRTLVIFTSDNGMMYGHHRLRGKSYAYTPSLRVPLVMRGPGVRAGVRRHQPVGTIDLAPTIADAAGVATRPISDGRSLLALAKRGAVGAHRTMLLEMGQSPGKVTTWPTKFYTGVHTSRWVYLEYGTGERELYNQARDPFQLRSRHADRHFRDVRKRLARVLDRLRDCAGSACR